jgi:hypothetical protein
VASFINENFLPVESHIKEHPAWFHRFDATWTPTVLILDSKGDERHRIEGYLAKDEFEAQLRMGLARIAFKEKKWPEAERIYGKIIERIRKLCPRLKPVTGARSAATREPTITPYLARLRKS